MEGLIAAKPTIPALVSSSARLVNSSSHHFKNLSLLRSRPVRTTNPFALKNRALLHLKYGSALQKFLRISKSQIVTRCARRKEQSSTLTLCTQDIDDVTPLGSTPRHAIITGGNSGIGKAMAMALACKGWTLTLACRSLERGSAAASEISNQAGNPAVSAHVCDLASLDSVRNFALAYVGSGRPLHVLVNNAGVMACPRMDTEDGFELHLGVNHIGHFELTRLLLPSLAKSGSARNESRVVVLTSAAETIGNIDFNDLNFTGSSYYFRWNAYAQSKLANSLFTMELARRMAAASLPVTANCFHPGIVDSELIRHVLPQSVLESRRRTPEASARFARLIGLKTVEEGASTGVFLATSPDVEGKSGGYYVQSWATQPSRRARDHNLAERLWQATEGLTGHSFDVEVLPT